ncbi:MAG TPA: hypothetical protein PKX38_03905 [Alphaproteobacteria bacterium]|nr:hypothetical protein [Micavibrio sp.]MBK9563488.1 hypothetical protein [Micavibrio sp.]HQX27063.1 hypothetical protein [Alphaproteobacteria bacterium]
MFGMLWFKAKVLRVLKYNFGYEPGSFQFGTLNEVCKQARLQKVTEYDGAIMFMFVQINSLDPNIKTQEFVKKHLSIIYSLLHESAIPFDASAMADELAIRHGLNVENLR